MSNILKIYINVTIIYLFSLKEWKLKKSKACSQFIQTEYVIYIKYFKQALGLAKIIYWYECWAKRRVNNDFKKDIFKLMNNVVLGKIIENVKTHRYQTCKNWGKKEWLSTKSKFSDRNEENIDTDE